MTRFARAGIANKKKPGDASSWEELKKTSSSTHTKNKLTSKSKPKKHDDDDKGQSAKLNLNESSTKAFKKKKKMKGTSASPDVRKRDSKPTPSTSAMKNVSVLSHFGENETFKFNPANVGQSSKSLIEELEEMDKQQLAEANQQKVAQYQDEDRTIDSNRKETMDKEELRSENRRLKRQHIKANKMVCYHCRESGHGVADCPKALADVEQGTGVCFRCGSTEHDVSQCTARIDPNEGEFPFAKCFICQEKGHLSKSCPDNPRGLYPMGGCCEHCESVEHRSWDCPHNKQLKGVEEIQLSTYSSTSHHSADAEDFGAPRQRVVTKKKGPKIVKF